MRSTASTDPGAHPFLYVKRSICQDGGVHTTPARADTRRRSRRAGESPPPSLHGPGERERERDATWSIGELAAAAGVSARTIRYYEDLGVFPEPARTRGGTRRYGRQWRFYLEGAIALKELGFSLTEIRLIGRLAVGDPLDGAERVEAAQVVAGTQSSLEHRLTTLNRLCDLLARIDQLHRTAPVSARQMARMLSAPEGESQRSGTAPDDQPEETT